MWEVNNDVKIPPAVKLTRKRMRLDRALPDPNDKLGREGVPDSTQVNAADVVKSSTTQS